MLIFFLHVAYMYFECYYPLGCHVFYAFQKSDAVHSRVRFFKQKVTFLTGVLKCIIPQPEGDTCKLKHRLLTT